MFVIEVPTIVLGAGCLHVASCYHLHLFLKCLIRSTADEGQATRPAVHTQAQLSKGGAAGPYLNLCWCHGRGVCRCGSNSALRKQGGIRISSSPSTSCRAKALLKVLPVPSARTQDTIRAQGAARCTAVLSKYISITGPHTAALQSPKQEPSPAADLAETQVLAGHYRAGPAEIVHHKPMSSPLSGICKA